MTDFLEHQPITPSQPLRQGDILESTKSSPNRWQRHLLVITADCDFAHEKHNGRVTCVPLLSTEEYLSEIQIPRLRERQVAKLLDCLAKLMLRSHPNMTLTRLREWVSEEDAERIIETLSVRPNDIQVAKRAIDAIKLLDAKPSTFEDAVTSLIEAKLVGPNPPKPENAKKEISSALRDAMLRPPGDALFLSPIAPEYENGHFAYLRHLEQLPQAQIAIGPLHRAAQYRRILRLRDRYTLALTQQFGLVFMSIGLPCEYEELRSFHSEMLGEKFT